MTGAPRDGGASGEDHRGGPAAEQPQPEPQSRRSVDLTDEPVHWDLGNSLSYGEYLRLDDC